jgi:hypothetical protein
MNCGVDVADIAVLILFTCWKLWGDPVTLPDELTLTLKLGDPDTVTLTLEDREDVPDKLWDVDELALELELCDTASVGEMLELEL